MRDNMNYQEYNFSFDPSSISSATTTTTTSDPWQTSLGFGSCIGKSCCSTGLTYDTSLNRCVVADSSTTPSSTSSSSSFYAGLLSEVETFVTESMINNILTKKQLGKYKSDYNIKSPNPSNT